jgi:hypothetical protein
MTTGVLCISLILITALALDSNSMMIASGHAYLSCASKFSYVTKQNINDHVDACTV